MFLSSRLTPFVIWISLLGIPLSHLHTLYFFFLSFFSPSSFYHLYMLIRRNLNPDPYCEQIAICRGSEEGRQGGNIYGNSLSSGSFVLRCFLSSLVVLPGSVAGISLEGKVAASAIRFSFQRVRMKPRLIKQNERALAALHWEFSIPLVMKY